MDPLDYSNVSHKRNYPYFLTEAQAAHYAKLSVGEFRMMVKAEVFPKGNKEYGEKRWSKFDLERAIRKFQNELLQRLDHEAMEKGSSYAA